MIRVGEGHMPQGWWGGEKCALLEWQEESRGRGQEKDGHWVVGEG